MFFAECDQISECISLVPYQITILILRYLIKVGVKNPHLVTLFLL